VSIEHHDMEVALLIAQTISDFADPTDFADDTTALTIAASATFCGSLLAVLAAATTPEWGGRLGFLALAISSFGAFIGFAHVSRDVSIGNAIGIAIGGVILVLVVLALVNRLRSPRGDAAGD
jgi:hypothetical protein